MTCDNKLRSFVYFDSTLQKWMLCFRGEVPKNQYEKESDARQDLYLLLKGDASIEWGCVNDHTLLWNRAKNEMDIWGEPIIG